MLSAVLLCLAVAGTNYETQEPPLAAGPTPSPIVGPAGFVPYHLMPRRREAKAGRRFEFYRPKVLQSLQHRFRQGQE